MTLGRGEWVGVMSCLGVRHEPWWGLGSGESRGLKEREGSTLREECWVTFSDIGGGDSSCCNLKKIYKKINLKNNTSYYLESLKSISSFSIFPASMWFQDIFSSSKVSLGLLRSISRESVLSHFVLEQLFPIKHFQ